MIGHTVIRLAEVGSTNEYAKALLDRPDSDGLAVLALAQTKGKGRMGRNWFSPPGTGLYLSVILKDHLKSPGRSLLCPAAALAAVIAIEKLSGLKASIKWPNDVMLADKKAGGILVEQSGGALIIGIGLNLNTEQADFPEDIRRTATSVLARSGKKCEQDAFLVEYFPVLEELIIMLERGRGDELLKKVEEHSDTLGREVDITASGGQFRGKAVGLESDGSLLLETANGKIINIKSGEIS